jgi:spore germination cell wall hydrolase CwlJ-like protein
MNTKEILALGDLLVLALTIDGESEGEPVEGQIAVGCVIRNRVVLHPARFGRTYADVCLTPLQFSCWQDVDGAANHARILVRARAIEAGQTPMDPAFRQCRYVASGIISGDLRDNTNGSSHYVTRALHDSLMAPAWVKQARVLAHIGSQIFMVA